jgi:hypothetical protein
LLHVEHRTNTPWSPTCSCFKPFRPHSPSGLLPRSSVHTLMLKRSRPRSKHTSRVRSVNGSPNVRILPHYLEMCRRSSKRTAYGSGCHNRGLGSRLVACYLSQLVTCNPSLTYGGHRTWIRHGGSFWRQRQADHAQSMPRYDSACLYVITGIHFSDHCVALKSRYDTNLRILRTHSNNACVLCRLKSRLWMVLWRSFLPHVSLLQQS